MVNSLCPAQSWAWWWSKNICEITAEMNEWMKYAVQVGCIIPFWLLFIHAWRDVCFNTCKSEPGITLPMLIVQWGRQQSHPITWSQGRTGRCPRWGPTGPRQLSSPAAVRSGPLQTRPPSESRRDCWDFHFEFFRCVNSISIWNKFSDLVIIRSLSLPTALLL